MEIEIRHDEGNILVIETSGKMTWEEFHDLIKTVEQEAAQYTTRFDLILVAGAPPPSGNPLPHFQRMHQTLKSLEHLGLAVNVSNNINGFAKAMVTIILRLAGAMKNVTFAASMDEAYTQIRKSRQTPA